MTGSTEGSDVVAADTVPKSRRRVGLPIALLATFGLILLAATQAGPGWVHGAASVGAALAAMVVLFTAELRWMEWVTTAESAGLVSASGC
ncbi:hypothetical protein A5784_16130 [Mycobacterium sp. 852013-50091_SCH5140682]|uniref:hypothetical protein n=1 Tax=Mycobacterium sp. 852013-50091_SCH5140682 TaxID=1834109 RepID=UPI0007E95AE8|nr:hypothetical protein [Mycobacterium sp. 852013-50091_SCH5140682]OBC02432.1 hypothetical protein A5784_16130 [Mycobacterium sp. 852013-50091_SCH5140682]